MPDAITPHATPIAPEGEPTWFPPTQDDNRQAAPEPSGVRYVFFGKDGLRAGWSLLLFVTLSFAIGWALFRLGAAAHLLPKHLRGGGDVTPGLMLPGEAIQFLAPALAALVMTRIEQRRFAQYGLGSFLARAGQFGVGLLWGVAALSLLVGLLWATHLLVFTGLLLHGTPALHWGLVWALGFLLVGLSEEYLTRGYAQFTLARGIAGIAQALGMSERGRKTLGFWLAAVFFSFLFGLGHKSNPGESPIGLLSAGLIGLVFCFSLWRTGSLWWAVGMHTAWDWSESFLYGVADSGQMVQHHLQGTQPQGRVLLSGGLTGPEGSVYVLGIILLLVIGIALTLRSQRGSPSQPDTWDTYPNVS